MVDETNMSHDHQLEYSYMTNYTEYWNCKSCDYVELRYVECQ